MPISQSPVADSTGELAGLNQPDDIWFLAGSYGERLRRTCTVPAGRDLFLPVLNMWHWPADGPPLAVEKAYGSLVVDGQHLTPELISTPVPFMVLGARKNGVTHGQRARSVTVWGLWKYVPALTLGEHDLHIVGGDGRGFVVDVSYSLVVDTVTAAQQA